jgi:hypothetical protein
MKSSTKKILVFGGLAVAGYLAYQYYMSQQGVTVEPSGTAPGLVPLPSSTMAMPAPGIVKPQAVPSTPGTYTNGAGVSIPAWLQAWAQGTGVDAPIYVAKVWPTITSMDLNNLTNIVANYFNTGIAVTPALNSWWGVFTAKYGLS